MIVSIVYLKVRSMEIVMVCVSSVGFRWMCRYEGICVCRCSRVLFVVVVVFGDVVGGF